MPSPSKSSKATSPTTLPATGLVTAGNGMAENSVPGPCCASMTYTALPLRPEHDTGDRAFVSSQDVDVTTVAPPIVCVVCVESLPPPTTTIGLGELSVDPFLILPICGFDQVWPIPVMPLGEQPVSSPKSGQPAFHRNAGRSGGSPLLVGLTSNA